MRHSGTVYGRCVTAQLWHLDRAALMCTMERRDSSSLCRLLRAPLCPCNVLHCTILCAVCCAQELEIYYDPTDFLTNLTKGGKCPFGFGSK